MVDRRFSKQISSTHLGVTIGMKINYIPFVSAASNRKKVVFVTGAFKPVKQIDLNANWKPLL
ncbi:hypothetical protein L0244_13325 [bacterium]|nr:hypothetical protein [bacterium]